MRSLIYPLAMIFCVVWTSSSLATGERLKSGPQAGDTLRPFLVEKCAGSERDRVKIGQKLCYRCKLGNRPVVAVFARHPDRWIYPLLKALDGLVAKDSNKQLASFVSLLGEDKQKLKTNAESLVKQSQVKHIPVVVPVEHSPGPQHYQLNPRADLTVLVYREGKVQANFAMKRNQVTKQSIREITKAAAKLAESSN